ncbi:MAG: AEC family transporter [Candidatus Gastranaerophilaceae bacterium]|nr:AEC family transporter [Christensenellales bacterium]
MSEMLHSLSAVLLVLMIISVGYAFGRFGWMRKEHKKFVIKLIINVGMPALCAYNIFTQFSSEMLSGAGYLVLLPILSMAATLILGVLLSKLLRIERIRRGGFIVMCAFSNSIFVGLPMCRELFGEAAVPYVMFFYLVNTSLFWTIGNSLIQRSGDREGTKHSFVNDAKRMATPPLITLLVCIPLLLIGFEPPRLLISFCSYLGNIVTPLALLYVGYLLFETGIKNIRIDRGMTAVMLMRFIIAPATMLLLCTMVGFGGIGENVFVIEAAMPVMTQAVVVASSVEADEKYVAAGMSLTTLACFIAVPLLMLAVKAFS